MGKGKKQNMDVHNYNNYVVRHDSENHFVVNRNKYETTLRQWLEKEENQNNWCVDYGNWGAYRPKEEARKIIQGILRVVYELHSHNFYHGRLYHPENYVIQDNKVVIGGDHKENKYIFLTHENREWSEKFGFPNYSQLGDRRAVLHLIFGQILRAEPNGTCGQPWKYAEDLRNLHDLLQKTYLSSHEWKLLVNHPSLWHWESRFVYFDRVWMYFKQAEDSELQRMKGGFSNIKPEEDWKSKIPPDSPLIKVYNHCKNSYGKSTEDLIRYFRNVRAHYKENVEPYHAKQYLEPQYIELKITEVSESFLVKLYGTLCRKNIEI